jgi:DNA-binding response OmpR family regulator
LDQRTRIVVLTSFADRQKILDAIDAGAIGYLLKDADPDEIVRGGPRGRSRRVAARSAGSQRGPSGADDTRGGAGPQPTAGARSSSSWVTGCRTS